VKLRWALALAVIATPSTASASGAAETAFVVGTAIVIGDAYAVVHDLRGKPVDGLYAVVETVWMTPQAIVFGALAVDSMLERPRDPALGAVAAAFAGFTGALATHGIWSLANRDKPSNEILGVAAIAAMDASLLGGTIVAHAAGLAVRPFGVAAIFLAGPATIGSIYGLSTDDKHRAGWITLTAASSALLAHGVIVTVFGASTSTPTPAPIVSASGRVVPGVAWAGAF
jgi:hypothetical protein